MTSFLARNRKTDLHDSESGRWPREVREDDQWFSPDCEDAPGKDFSIPFESVLRRRLEQFPLIAMDADVLAGTPRISGTRIPVNMVIEAVQFYGSVEDALKSYPSLTIEHVRAALSFVAAVMEHPVDHEPKTTS